MLVVGIDLGTQSIKAVVCDERLEVLGSRQVACTTDYPQPGWAEQDPAAWLAALAPAIGGALAAAGVHGKDIAAIALAGQLDGCVPVAANGAPLHRALIWQDRRATDHLVGHRRTFEITGQVDDPTHLGPKIGWLQAHGIRAARYHLPTTFVVERLTGAAAIDPSHASTTLLFELAANAWSSELLARYELDAAQLPAIAPTCAIAGTLTAAGAALTGLPAGTPVAVGTGDDFGTPLGAGLAGPGPLSCTLGTAECVGTISAKPVLDLQARRAASDPWRALATPMVETHTYPAGGYFIQNPGWLSGGAVRWATRLLGLASDAELDALAASAPPGAAGVTFIPALTGAMTPAWWPHARGALYGLSAHTDRAHVARAVLEGLAFACRDIAGRVRALGLPIDHVVVLGGGGQSKIWMQIRADALQLPHHVAARADTCAVGAAMIAAVAAGMQRDLAAACKLAPASALAAAPRGSLDEAYARYCRLVEELSQIASRPW